jgi:DNA-directed RNA polymerase
MKGELMDSLYDEQIKIEEEANNLSFEKYQKSVLDAIKHGRFDDTSQGKALMRVMFEPINDKIVQYLGTTYRGHTQQLQSYIKLMSDDSREITYVLIKTLVTKIVQNNNLVQTISLASNISKTLKRLHYFNRLKADNPKLHAYLGSEYKRASARRKEMLIEKHLKALFDADDTGSSVQDIRAGTQLLELVMTSGIDILVQSRRKIKSSKPKYFISFTKEALEAVFSSGISQTTINKPMIVPPRDWVSLSDGGYLENKLTVIKTRGDKKTIRALEGEDLSKVLPVINKLQKTAWRVNTRVLDVIKYIFDNNLIDPTSPPTLPRLYGDIPTANSLDVSDLLESREYIKSPTPEEKEAWFIWNKKREQIRINLDGETGRRLQTLLTFDMAEYMKKYERFWYVYQLDYRGRVYPNTDFLNPQSKGYVKSILEFADGEILDEVGVRWLKIHIANCYGLDKEPFDARLKWSILHTKSILLVAEDPLSNLELWVNADSPYEYLAACFAYSDYTKGLPVHTPIQLDAVNSGIQMYSGLLLDKVGAESCCVIGDKRSDLYKLVAERVNSKLEKGDYVKTLTFKDSSGEERLFSTKEEALSICPKYDIIEVPDDYILKEGEEWYQEM